jgi:hypothetical protein
MAEGKNFGTKEEFAGLNFHSARLEQRFIRTMETLIQQPDDGGKQEDTGRDTEGAVSGED